MSFKQLIRVYSETSSGGLTSGRKDRHTLTPRELIEEFNYHRVASQRKRKTALISTTDFLLSAMKRAFDRYTSPKLDDDPAQIYLTFICVPGTDKDIYYHGNELAEKAGMPIWKQERYKSEYLFAWEIPTKYVQHTVSLQTLIDRSLHQHLRWLDVQLWDEHYPRDEGDKHSKLPTSSDIRAEIVKDVTHDDYYWHGWAAANTALCFGFEAPIRYIADEIASLKPSSWTDLRIRCCIDSGIEDFLVNLFTNPEIMEKKELLKDAWIEAAIECHELEEELWSQRRDEVDSAWREDLIEQKRDELHLRLNRYALRLGF